MQFRFVTKDIHAVLDYPVALALMAAPFALPLGDSHPAARWLTLLVGVAALVLTLLTNHRLGVLRLLPYWLHVVVDALVGVVFLIAPIVFGFTGIDLWFYLANGAAVMTVVSLSAPGSLADSDANTRQPMPRPAV